MSVNDANYLKESRSSWKCPQCLKGINNGRNDVSITDGDPVDVTSSGPLTVEHFHAIMAAINDIKADNISIRGDIAKIQENIDSCFDEMTKINERVASVSKSLGVCEANISVIDKRSVKVENDLRVLHHQVQKVASHQRDDVTTTASTEEVLLELNERKLRERNLILFGIEESTAERREDRIRSDFKIVEECLRPLHDGIDFFRVDIRRMGKYQAHNVRPLRVTLTDASDVKSILKNKNKNRTSVKISSDQTPSQRNHLKQLQDQLKGLVEAGETNKTIKYINNMPRIVNKSPKN